MLFTAKFTALVFAVVAATFCQVTAKPAPVEASSDSNNDALMHGLDTIDANVTRVGQPIDSAAPQPAVVYHFQYSTRLLGGATCSEAASDVGVVTVRNENMCTPITVTPGRIVQCIRPMGSSASVDLGRITVCGDSACDTCYTLSSAPSRPDNFFLTTNAATMYVRNAAI